MEIAPEISIVVCTRDTDLFSAFVTNVRETVGTSFEVIDIDNSHNDYSIFEAYNEGVRRSVAPIICFAHEDIRFHTAGWGKRVLQHFSDPDTGMIGVAGGNGYPDAPAPWWNNAFGNEHLVNLVQHWKRATPRQHYNEPMGDGDNITRTLNNPRGALSERAVVVDGLWFCIRAALFGRIRFDEQTFNGFHCYDMDISLQVHGISDLRVVFDILIEHLSEGNASRAYYEACITLHQKWTQQLPISYVCGNNSNCLSTYSYKALLDFAYAIRSSGVFSDAEIRKVIATATKNLDSRFDLFEFYILAFWRLLGYTPARVPNFAVRMIFGR